MRFRGRRITDSAKKRISQKAKDAEQNLKKAKSKESFWVVRKLKELWQKVTQPHVLKAAAASLISAAVSAAIVAIKSRMNAKKQLEAKQREYQNSVGDLREEIDKKEEELKHTEEQLRDKKRYTQSLNEEITENREHIKYLSERLKGMQDRVDKLQEERSFLESRLHETRNDYTRDLSAANNRIRTLAQSSDNLRRNNELLRDRINRLEEEINNTSEQGREAGELLARRRERLRQIEERLTEANRELGLAIRTRNNVRREVSDLRQNEETEVRRILQIHQRSIETQQEINAYEHTIRTLNPEAARIRQEVMREQNIPAHAAGVDPRSAEFAEAGRYNGLTSESIGQNSGTAHNNAFSGINNRFSSILSRRQGSARGNVNRQAFRNVQRKGASVDQLIEQAREQNLPRGTNVFNERNNRYSSLELDSAYALWLNQFDF